MSAIMRAIDLLPSLDLELGQRLVIFISLCSATPNRKELNVLTVYFKTIAFHCLPEHIGVRQGKASLPLHGCRYLLWAARWRATLGDLGFVIQVLAVCVDIFAPMSGAHFTPNQLWCGLCHLPFFILLQHLLHGITPPF